MKTQEKMRTVLVLGSKRRKAFLRMLNETELAPVFVSSLEGILHAVRHTQAIAILVDREQRRTDELELVLNVRDLDPQIPIVLIGTSHKDPADEVLSNQRRTFLIPEAIDSRSLAGCLKGFTKDASFSGT
jgi:DNA-binding NtrC family response regulator